MSFVDRLQTARQAVLFIDFTKQEQSGFRGDVATEEVGFNLTAGEWRKGQFFRCHFGNGCWCLVDWLRS